MSRTVSIQKSKLQQLNNLINLNSIYNYGVICLLLTILSMDLLKHNFWQYSKLVACTIFYPLLVMSVFLIELLYKCITKNNFLVVRTYSRLILLPCVLFVALYTAYPLGYLITNNNHIFINHDTLISYLALSIFYILIAYCLYVSVFGINESILEKSTVNNKNQNIEITKH